MTWSNLATAVTSFAVLAGVFIPLERAFPARAGQKLLRREWHVDACFFFGQYLLWMGLAAGILGLVRRFFLLRLHDLVLSGFSSQPLWAQVVEVVVAGDVLVYWFHRACHRYDVLWRFHAVHHSTEELDWLAAHREHPLDGFLTQLCQNLPAIVVGLRLDVLGPLAVLRGGWGIFIHSNTRVRLGPLGLLLGAPELHHFHHARVARSGHNFANLAPWLDVVFRTYLRPTGEETYPLGLDGPWPRGYFAQLARPFLPATSVSRRQQTPAPIEKSERDPRPAGFSVSAQP